MAIRIANCMPWHTRSLPSHLETYLMLNLIFFAILVRLPDGGTTLALLSLSLGSIAFIRAKLK